jgi:hypothetical protein
MDVGCNTGTTTSTIPQLRDLTLFSSSRAVPWRTGMESVAHGGTVQEPRFRFSSSHRYVPSHFPNGLNGLITRPLDCCQTKAECTIRPHIPRDYWNPLGQLRSYRVYDLRVGCPHFSSQVYVLTTLRLATNIIVSSMLILGGSATVTSLTGMNTIAACFLIPLGVSIYVVVGGMRSTILCD